MADMAVINSTHSSGAPSLPQGPLMIVSALEAQGYEVEFHDYQTQHRPDQGDPEVFYRFLREAQADIIGISVFSSSLPTALLAVRKLKEECPGKTIVMGGPAATDTPEDILRFFPVDIVVRGEGEVTVVEMMRAIESGADLAEVAGLSFKRNGNIISTPNRPRIADLDSLPYPAYDRVDFRNYGSSLGTVYSRGCPYECSFCSVHSVWQRKMTHRSPESLAEEIAYVVSSHPGEITEVAYHDDTFVLDEKRVTRLLRALRERGVELPWFCYGRVNLMPESLVRTMSDFNCSKVLFGIESGSDAVLKRIRKRFTGEEARRTVNLTRSYIPSTINTYIYGFPFETIEAFHETVFSVLDDRQKGIVSNLYLLCPLPQSPLYSEFQDILRFSPRYHSLLGTPSYFARYPEIVAEIVAHPQLFSAYYHYEHPELEDKMTFLELLDKKGLKVSVR
jgi:anaerobic magnesium-protoporphyrin IX monomethyl ester cyclase